MRAMLVVSLLSFIGSDRPSKQIYSLGRIQRYRSRFIVGCGMAMGKREGGGKRGVHMAMNELGGKITEGYRQERCWDKSGGRTFYLYYTDFKTILELVKETSKLQWLTKFY